MNIRLSVVRTSVALMVVSAAGCAPLTLPLECTEYALRDTFTIKVTYNSHPPGANLFADARFLGQAAAGSPVIILFDYKHLTKDSTSLEGVRMKVGDQEYPLSSAQVLHSRGQNKTVLLPPITAKWQSGPSVTKSTSVEVYGSCANRFDIGEAFHQGSDK